MNKISSWGRLSAFPHHLISLSDANKVSKQISHQPEHGLAYGMGRSYGDVCLNPDGTLWRTTGLDRFITFDDNTGQLTCEAGVLLRDIQRLFIPRGWMLPVTPGTQMVTVGGAIANDVHGKNHHVFGSFGDHIQQIKLARTDGSNIICGANQASEWFSATVGGLGLTGVITEATLQLRRISGPWLETETIPYANLNEFFQLADASEAQWEHTVSWIDCLSGKNTRGIFMRGNHSQAIDKPNPSTKQKTMPLVPPISLVNKLSLRPFNFAYYHLKKFQAGPAISHYESFFYPLDNLLEWNRMYGPKGFFQYQCVIPREFGQDAIQAMLKSITLSGDGSFLAVLKTFGNRQALGMLSFPRPGVTFALDFPNQGERTHHLFERLDGILREAKGRIYLAKDARAPRELFEAGYPRLNEFLKFRDAGISSALSRRLMGA